MCVVGKMDRFALGSSPYGPNAPRPCIVGKVMIPISNYNTKDIA